MIGDTSSATTPQMPIVMATFQKSSDGGSVSSRPATSPAKRLPRAAPTNQTPIICPTRSRGASLVIDDNPTGERLSSPTVCRKYVTTSQLIETLLVAVALAAPQAMTKKPADRASRASANFIGIDGLALRRASHVHSQPKTGAKTMMKIGFTF